MYCSWINKTESKVNITEIGVGDTMVIPNDTITNLGVIVDENLSIDIHIAIVSRTICVSIRNTGIIRKHINQPVTRSLCLDWTRATHCFTASTKRS